MFEVDWMEIQGELAHQHLTLIHIVIQIVNKSKEQLGIPN